MNLRLAILFFSVALLTACSAYVEFERDARVTRLADGRFEIEIRSHGRAYNPHGFSLLPFRFRESNWLYVKANQGIVPAIEVIVTSEKGTFNRPAADQFQVGLISFQGDSMHVELKKGRYRSMFAGNGDFHLIYEK